MDAPVVAGFDGSPESLAATEWALREAQRRRAPLTLLRAWPWPHRDVVGTDESFRRAQEHLTARAAELVDIAPEVPVTASPVSGDPVEALEEAGRTAALLALGSRGSAPSAAT